METHSGTVEGKPWLYRAKVALDIVRDTKTKHKGGTVAICGTGPTVNHCPPRDSMPNFEVWVANNGYKYVTPDRIFAMDALSTLKQVVPDMVEEFKKIKGVPLYMSQKHDEIPASVKYPMDDIVYLTGIGFLTSTPAFMVALAIYEGVRAIHLYGVDIWCPTIREAEYRKEAPGLEYWLGLAEGKGIEVHIPWVTMKHLPPIYGDMVRAQYVQTKSEASKKIEKAHADWEARKSAEVAKVE